MTESNQIYSGSRAVKLLCTPTPYVSSGCLFFHSVAAIRRAKALLKALFYFFRGGPFVFGIAALELFPYRWIMPLPKSGKILRYLDGAVIRRQQMYGERNASGAYLRRLFHAKKILQS